MLIGRKRLETAISEKINNLNVSINKHVPIQKLPIYTEDKECMQFVKAMIEYCKPAIHNVSLEQQTYFKSFVTWLDNTKKDFKELHNYIKESTICA